MFFSSCSLFSPQCAALIALAAAAGIVRTELSHAETRETAGAVNVRHESLFEAETRNHFQLQTDEVAPWLQMVVKVVASHLSPRAKEGLHAGDSGHSGNSAVGSAELRLVPCLAAFSGGLNLPAVSPLKASSRRHFWPFSGGPPDGKVSPLLRSAVSTPVHGETARRSYSITKIAVGFRACHLARLTRGERPGLTSAPPPSSLSFALRGDSGFLAIIVRPPLRASSMAAFPVHHFSHQRISQHEII